MRGEILKRVKNPIVLAVVVITAVFLIVFNLILPLFQKQAEATTQTSISKSTTADWELGTTNNINTASDEMKLMPNPRTAWYQTGGTWNYRKKIVKSGDTTNWKSYSSKELGLSFKYPEVWGEPYTHLEDYSDQKQLNNPYFAGRFYSVCFSEGRYCVVGYSADYKIYESAVDNYYIGDEKSLDTAETDVARDSKKSTISFIQKAAVAAVMTRTKTLFYYLSEASGVGARSQTYLNGKSDYPGLLISTYYKNLSDSLNILYDKTGGKNEALEKKAEEELKTLEGGTSNSQSQFNLYKTWLTTFSYNK